MTDKHWTSKSSDNLRFSVLCNFADQIHDRIQENEISYDDLAKLLGVHRNIVVNSLSKLFLPPFDFLLKCAFVLDLKLTIMTYPKEDNSQSTVHSSIFQECWDKAGKPRTGFDLEKVDKAPMPEKPKCAHCGSTEGVKLEPGRTQYCWDGQGNDPNGPTPYCRKCAEMYHKHWDEMWEEYRFSSGL